MRTPTHRVRACRAQWVTTICLVLVLAQPGLGQEAPTPPERETCLEECLVIERVGRYGRSAVHLDAIEAEIVAGRWSAPSAGETVTLADGTVKTWQPAEAGDDGWLSHEALGGGYAYTSVEAEVPHVMILDARGHGMVYVNGLPRAGDPYQNGCLRLPVLLREGTNDLLFHCSRGRLKAELAKPTSPVMLDTRDSTMPDLMVGEGGELWGAVVVINSTTSIQDTLAIRASIPRADERTTPIRPVAPLSTRKVGFRFQTPVAEDVDVEAGDVPLNIQLVERVNSAWRILNEAEVAIRVRRPAQEHNRTFVSGIDGSVQYYAVTPAKPAGDNTKPPALVLTLHGAGVEAEGQAQCYSPKTWGYVVAPTNRRPFGFDWEDWGRLDAMEVLALAEEHFHTDPLRTYLTGHSMGGHGVWHIGVTFPDQFAAIAPSAGWISFWSYGGVTRYEDPTPIEGMLIRATAPTDTLTLSRNYLHNGVYILHGEKDDNVPVGQARTMVKHLAEFHPDFAYYERPGVGHWWDVSKGPGTDCVDWPPMFDFFKRHTSPERHAVRHVEFATASPGVSARCHWVGIEAQVHAMKPSKVDIRLDTKARKFSGTTENVARLAVHLADLSKQQWREEKDEKVDATPLPPGEPLTVELDGQLVEGIPWPADELRIWLTREGGKWSAAGAPSPSVKGPHRCGPFKDAFRNRLMFVVGTQGTGEENAWAAAKARYDAETFRYRGNGSVDVLADMAFDPAKEPDRNVILYGNADTNAAWAALLGDSPVQVGRGAVRIGERELCGDDLACLFLRPRPGSDRASVGVVSGTGPVGMRLTDRLPCFVSGVAYPDCIVLSPDVLTKGTGGIRAAGFFGSDWSVVSGEFATSD
ncbi:MAG: prolyl oligopeptidase family serine peptidase [Phycisphaerae bacterium]|nr:prolyl oligopeptidase family serine peptidase [Phycisphaerae bacterium]